MLKFKVNKLLIKLFFILFLLANINCLEEANSVEDSHFEKEILRLKDIYARNDNVLTELVKDIELYTPNFNFEQPEKYRRESFWKLYGIEKGKPLELNKDIYVIPEELIEDTENIHRKNMMEKLIKKELNIDEVKLKDEFEVYGYPDAKSHQASITKLEGSNKRNIKIKEFSEISEMIQFDPKEINLHDKPILIPTMALVSIRNTMEEEMIINSVKSDLYQMTIFYFKPGKDSNQSYNQKNVYPKILHSGEEMLFQIIILADMIGKIRGNIFFEIEKNIVVIYPVLINAVENIYRIHPVYSPNWSGSELLSIPLSIYNPHSKTLIIKEVMNSFTSINLLWPNGEAVTSNNTSVSSSMLEIPPKTNKNIMVINFYKESSGAEYGLLQMKTDRDTIIIPVFIRVEIKTLRFYPKIVNFGVIDLDQTIKRAIPISITNVGLTPIEIKMMYTDFDDNFIEFFPKKNRCFKNFNVDNTAQEKTLCQLEHSETIPDFGFIVFDPKKYQVNGPISKHVKGKILFLTNSSENPFVELNYEFHVDRNIIVPINYFDGFKNGQFILSMPPESNNEISSIRFEIDFKLKSPYNISYSTISEKGYYYFYAQNNFFTNSNSQNSNNQLPAMELYEKEEFTKLVLTFETLTQEMNNNKNFARKIYHIPIPSSYESFVIVPIKLIDNYIDVYCCYTTPDPKEILNNNNITVYRKVNKKNSLVTINLGMVSVAETAISYFIVINDNDKEVNIIDVKSTNGEFLLGLDSVLDIETMEKIPNKTKFNTDHETLQGVIKRKFISRDSEKIQIGLTGNSITVFSVNMSSNIEQEMTETITITFDNSNRLFVNVRAKFLKGNLNISPSLIRFEPAFPGFYQHKLVSSKSSYQGPLTIHSVESMDQRIIPVLLAKQIIPNNRTEIIRINFDPSKVSLGENFMKEDFLFNTTTRYLTYKELYLWKEKQKLWELLGSQGRTEINTSVNIKTNIQSETVQIRAFLTKPSLFKKDDIDFGLVQIGESASKFIEVYNPSDEVITIQVLLATEDFSDIHNDKMFEKNKKFNLKRNDLITLMDCQYFNHNFGNPIISFNATQNTFSQNISKKRRKKEDLDGFDINNSFILDEELSPGVDGSNIDKRDLLKKIFLNSNDEVQNSINYIKKVICNINQMNKDEIILNRKELTEKLFSEDFNKDIPIVKKMTDCLPPSNHKKVNEGNTGIFDKIAEFFKMFFRTENSKKKRKTPAEQLKQDFFIPKIVSSQIHHVKPHQKMKIGPIIYHPTNLLNNTATLFIKNNLTILYPIKLKGNGGSGMLSFSLKKTDTNKQDTQVKKEVAIVNSRLSYSIDTTVPGEISDTILIRNTGNLAVKINSISIDNSGCESLGLKLSTCDSIELKPEESYEIKLTILPDFNFYFSEKEIIFSTQHGPVALYVSVHTHNQLLSIKNSLFNYDHLKNFGYISVLIIILVICVVLYFLTKEYEEIAKAKNRSNQIFVCLSLKDIVDSNPLVKFENLFIKAYRKFNYGFYDDFMLKQFDKPGNGNFDIETLGDKRKILPKVVKEKRIEELPRDQAESKEIIHLEPVENSAKLNIIETEVKEIKEKVVSETVVNLSKPNPTKKINDNKRIINKKQTTRPIGMPNLKGAEKKEETIINNSTAEQQTVNTNHSDKKLTEIINTPSSTNDNITNLITGPNKDNINTNSTNNPQVVNTQHNRPVVKDELINNNTNHYSGNDINVDHTVHNNYWQKAYHNKPIQQRHEYNQQNSRYNYYTKQYDTYYNYANNTGNKSFNYYNQAQKPNDGMGFKSNTSKDLLNVSPLNEAVNVNNLNSGDTSISEQNRAQIYQKNIIETTKAINEPNLSEDLNSSVNGKGISCFNSLNSAKKEIEISDKNDSKQFDSQNLNENSQNLDKDQPQNIIEQYNSFLPDFFLNKEKPNKSHSKQAESVKRSDFIDNQDNTIYKSFKNFDFSDIFNKPENKLITDDYKNLNEEDASSHNYQSEREKIDSGAEEFQFNFNSIFTQNKSNMKLPGNYNDNTDNEDLNNANKPYFDKNLLFPTFDWNKSQNGVFLSVNPFSNNTNKKLLDELREENNDEEDIEEKGKNKEDDIADENYDDEEPLWNADPTDIKDEGYFDVNGTYKLKQIDFNFDLDFKMKNKK